MGRMSNRDRIARAAEEARLTKLEKDTKKAEKVAKAPGKSPAKSRAKRSATPARMKVVWEVWRSSGATVKTFLYPDKEKAEATAAELMRSTGETHGVRAAKVPMD